MASKWLRMRFPLALALFFAASVAGWGQVITSSLVGNVSDTSGAAVPGAEIIVINEGTHVGVRASTGENGTYSVPDLLAGAYSVSITKAGFKVVTYTGIVIRSAQIVRQDTVLEIGNTTQSVTVQARTALLTTDSATMSSTLNSTMVKALPKTTETIDSLVRLAPGVQVENGVGGPWAAQPRGLGIANYWGGSIFTVNGVNVSNQSAGSAFYTAPVRSPAGGVSNLLVTLPPPDAIEEMNIQNGNMDASSTRLTNVTLVTRQGTNTFHGGVYEENQNTVFDAANFLTNARGQKKGFYNMNQFGGNVGGPIVRNRAFFFFDFGGMTNRDPVPTQLNLPSMAMRQGDFSVLCSTYTNGVCSDPAGTQLYNPSTGQPFPNNQVPTSMFASQSSSLLSFLPGPNTANSPGLPFGAPNWTALVPQSQEAKRWLVRADLNISNKDVLFGFWQHVTAPFGVASGGSPLNYGNVQNQFTSTSIVGLTETHTFGANTINNFRASWYKPLSSVAGQNLNFKPWTLFPQLPPSENGGLPNMNSMLGYTGMWHDVGNFLPSVVPIIEFTDNFTYIRGSHTFKAGFDEQGYKEVYPGGVGPLGAFSFNGQWTAGAGWPNVARSAGNSFADFLLGLPNTTTTGAGLTVNRAAYGRDWEFYGQDTWQATHRLTLTYGLRYTYQTPWHNKNNYGVTYLDLNNNKLVLPGNSSTVTAPPGVDPALLAQFPYETTQSAGFPLSYFKADSNNFAPRIGLAWRPLANGRTVLRAGYGWYYMFVPTELGIDQQESNPPWNSVSGNITFTSQLPGNPSAPFHPDITFANPFPVANALPGTLHPGLYMAQQQMVNSESQQWNLTAEHEWPRNLMTRVTYMGTATRHAPWLYEDINVPVAQVPNVSIQHQRPLQPWSTIYAVPLAATQNLNMLQLEAVERMSNGFQVQVEYAWTRCLGNLGYYGVVFGPQDWHNPKAEYGTCASIALNNLTANFLYTLPFGHGQRWLGNASRGLDALVGGWQVSGIPNYRTGDPLTVMFSVPSSTVGWWGGRADRVSGAPLYSGKQSGSHDIIGGVQWLNVGAFAPPQPWQWGNSAPGTFYGPSQWNVDLSVRKVFRITERQGVTFSTEFFDAFNHFNLGNPNRTIADTRDGGNPIPTAGKIFSGYGNRVIQLGLSYQF
ncbi:MAG: hypothetical protein EPN47_05310 [Acidobacteria bacterium]|nr:MAG: hypothetical protein EPN47_05310 [Acidobacteriota bacterium]